MESFNRKSVLVAVGLFLAGAACGYFALPAKIVTKTEIKTITQLVKDTSQDQNQHTKITVVSEKKPDGTYVTTTIKTQDSDTKTDTKENQKVDSDAKVDKEVTYSKSYFNLSVMASYSFIGAPGLSYGAAVSRQLLGPISVGVFGFTSGVGGVSLGLTF